MWYSDMALVSLTHYYSQLYCYNLALQHLYSLLHAAFRKKNRSLCQTDFQSKTKNWKTMMVYGIWSMLVILSIIKSTSCPFSRVFWSDRKHIIMLFPHVFQPEGGCFFANFAFHPIPTCNVSHKRVGCLPSHLIRWLHSWVTERTNLSDVTLPPVNLRHLSYYCTVVTYAITIIYKIRK